MAGDERSPNFIPLFHRAYGDAIAKLPPPIVRLHDVSRSTTWHGRATVQRGGSATARLVCKLMGFPPDGDDVALCVEMIPQNGGEVWRRSFAGHMMTSTLRMGEGGTIVERLPPMASISRIDCDAGGVTQVLVGLRAFGLPVPRPLWPKVAVREGAAGDRYTFSMAIHLPWNQPLVRYDGWLATADAPTGAEQHTEENIHGQCAPS